MTNYELVVFETANALAQAVAGRWLGQIKRETQTVALSGGRIAAAFYTAVVEQAQRPGPQLDRLHFFWADERCVPPDSSDSNYRVAKELLLDPLNIAQEQIHRVRGERDPGEAAATADAELRQWAASAKCWPNLDWVFLGMGEDGHVASLFPNGPAQTTSAAYVPVVGPKPPPQRVTLTYEVLEAAREVWVLVSGPGKKAALEASLAPGGQTPLGRVIEKRLKTLVFNVLDSN